MEFQSLKSLFFYNIYSFNHQNLMNSFFFKKKYPYLKIMIDAKSFFKLKL